MSPSRAPVVVGFDGSPTSHGALRYAADEAVLRGCPLRIVTASEGHLPRFDEPTPQELLQVATDLLRGMRVPDVVLPVESRGSAGTVLRAESADAELLVVGRGSAGGLGAFLGSVATDAVAGAGCPVLVIGDTDAPHVPHLGSVVVGVDVDDVSEEALEEAFFESIARGRDLVAMYASHPERFAASSSVLQLGLMADPDDSDAEARLREALAPWQAKHPSLPITVICRRGSASALLSEVGSAASMVVIGTRGRGRVAGRLLGSVAQSLLRHAVCPVLVGRPRQVEHNPRTRA